MTEWRRDLRVSLATWAEARLYVGTAYLVTWAVLERCSAPSEQTTLLLRALRGGGPEVLGEDEQGRWLAASAGWMLNTPRNRPP